MTVLVWVPTKVQPVENLEAVLARIEPGGELVLYGPPVGESHRPLQMFARGEWFRAEADAHDGSKPTVFEPLLL